MFMFAIIDDLRVEQRHVDVLPFAGARAMEQRGQDRDRRVHAGRDDPRPRRRLAAARRPAARRASPVMLIRPPIAWMMKS